MSALGDPLLKAIGRWVLQSKKLDIRPTSSIRVVYKSSIIVNLVRQCIEETQVATAHVKRRKKKYLTTLITQETGVESKALCPSDINRHN